MTAPTTTVPETHGSSTDYAVLSGLALLHLAAVVALFHFSWVGLGLFALTWWLTGSLGISLGFHRMLSHRSFRVQRWLELSLVVFGCLAMQGRPLRWVGVHRLHHADPDGPKDPHSPRHGLLWSHLGWMLKRDTDGSRWQRAARDLFRDKTLVWLNRFTPVLQLVSLAAFFALGELARWAGSDTSGLSCLLWAGALRTVVVYHSTWAVNSATHRFGYVNYRTRDDARNLWWVALLSFGEGWHNNHHAHAQSARIGHRWFELDITWIALWMFRLVGLARDVKLPRQGRDDEGVGSPS